MLVQRLYFPISEVGSNYTNFLFLIWLLFIQEQTSSKPLYFWGVVNKPWKYENVEHLVLEQLTKVLEMTESCLGSIPTTNYLFQA